MQIIRVRASCPPSWLATSCHLPRSSLASQTFFVGGACGKEKNVSWELMSAGNSCQLVTHVNFRSFRGIYHVPSHATRASHSSRACGEPVKREREGGV